MGLNSRVNALEKRSGADKGTMVILCVHEDSYVGDLGPGCRREPERDDVIARTGPKDSALCIHGLHDPPAGGGGEDET